MNGKKHGNDDPRGTVRGSAGIVAKWKQATAGVGSATAEWGYVDTSLLSSLVAAVTGAGAAIMFGYSQDRGAYLITILDGPDRHKEWIPCTTDVNEVLERLIDSLR